MARTPNRLAFARRRAVRAHAAWEVDAGGLAKQAPESLARTPTYAPLAGLTMAALDPLDTIAAIGSPSGPAVRGIVRLTGPDAWRVALAGFEDASTGRRSRHAEIRQGRKRVSGLRSALPAMIALWPEPKTFTGQPLAEIHTVGSPPLLNQVLADCLILGARLAERGEFTLRAFLTGRLDLTQAEAVLGVIEAQNPAQLDAALRQLAGGLATPIGVLRDRLLDVLAHLEAGLDFVDEEDVDPIGRAALAEELEAGAENLRTLAARLARRERTTGLPRVALVGAPNAGKSRLFNALAGTSRAIVSPVAGTTTDYLTATCRCDGIQIELIDTAGAEPDASPIQSFAQALRREQTEQADLRLQCQPCDESSTFAVPQETGPTLVVRTKCDLVSTGENGLLTSAESGFGIDVLRRAIAAALRETESDGNAVSSTGARCQDSLVRAHESILSAARALQLRGGDELVAIDLRQALEELGKVVGAVVTDDILDRIFQRFCIGK